LTCSRCGKALDSITASGKLVVCAECVLKELMGGVGGILRDQAVAELRALICLALVLAGNDDGWVTWAAMARSKLKQLGIPAPEVGL
jgi:hypothetical protein